MQKTKHAILSRGFSKTYLIKIVAYYCKICSEKVLCDTREIKNHVRIHQIKTLKEYVDKTDEIRESRKTQIENSFDNFCSKITMKQKPTQMVGNLCIFSCSKCDFSSKKWSFMKVHIKTCSHCPVRPPFLYATSTTLHKCQVCSKLVLCDKKIINQHISKHNYNIKTYKAMSNIPNQEEMFKEYKLKLKKIIQHIPIVDTKKVTWTLPPNSLPDDQVTHDVGNLCFFKCSLCHQSNMNYNGLKNHLRRIHKSSLGKIDKTQNFVEARYHECCICAKIVLCDYAILAEHLRLHKINLSKYVNDHVIKKGGKAYPTFKEFCSDPQVFETLKAGSESWIKDNQDKGLILPHMISSESEDSDEELH